MKRGSLSLPALVASAVTLLLCAPNGRSQNYTSGSWTYFLNASNEATIRSYAGPGGHVTIPSVIDGYTVKEVVGAYWGSVFGGTRANPNVTVTGLTIPEGVTTIGDYAFAASSSLASVVVPNSLTTVGFASFENCFALTKLVLGSSVTTIDAYAFKGCQKLASVIMPASVIEIALQAFTDCDSLTSVYFRGNAPSAHPDSFSFLSSAVTMFHPADASGWGSSFAGWPTQPYTLGTSGSWGYIVNSPGEATVRNYSGPGGHVTIPSSIDGFSIQAVIGAYWGSVFGATQAQPNSTVTGITIPDSVTTIGEYAFADTSLLTSVVVPDSVTTIGGAAFVNCFALTNLTIGSGVTAINAYAFKGCNKLTSVVIPAGVTDIALEAFTDCDSLTGVYFRGDAPSAHPESFSFISSSVTMYHLPDAAGWGPTFAGWPTQALSESSDGDGDGLNDAAELAMYALGFDLRIYQRGLVGALYGNANRARLFSESQYKTNRTNGQTDVTTNPSAFNLFNQSQFEANRIAGQQDVVSSPTVYGLYDSNSIMDLAMGGVLIQKQGANATVIFQTQTTTDLATLPFTNNGTPITNTVPMPGDKGFLRVRGVGGSLPGGGDLGGGAGQD